MCGLRGLNSPHHLLPLDILPIDSGADQRKEQHKEENLQQSPRGAGDGLGSFGQDGKASVNEFYVDPIDE